MFLVVHFLLLYFKLLFLFIISGAFCLLYFKLLFLFIIFMFLVEHFVCFILSYYFFLLFLCF